MPLINCKNTNDVVFAVAKRAKQLADMPMKVLRKSEEPDVSCITRGDIIEMALIEEFCEAIPKDIAED